MPEKIDIMKIEPTTNVERRLVTVTLTDQETILIEPSEAAAEPEYWIGLLSSITGIDPTTHAREFFSALPDRLDGTYVYARRDEHAQDSSDAPHVVGA